MRYAIVSDLHGRADQFERICRDAGRYRADRVILTGDYLESKVSKRRHDPTVRWDADQVIDHDPGLWRRLSGCDLVRGNQEERIADLLSADQVHADLAPLLRAPERMVLDSGLVLVHGHRFDWRRYQGRWIPGRRDIADAPGPVVCYGHSHERLAGRVPGGSPDGTVELLEVRAGHPIRLLPGYLHLLNLGAARESEGHWLAYDEASQTVTFREASA